MLRLIHTSDWHLGHHLGGLSREAEHEAFLQWLLHTVQAEQADALLIAGDIFDSANPPASAQTRWFQFLGSLRRVLPNLDVVVIGGNHDSAARLDAPDPILSALNLRVVGGLHAAGSADLDLDRLLVPITAKAQPDTPAAWVLAVPFLRPSDLPRVSDDTVDPLIAGVEARYRAVTDAALARREPGQALIAMGHCYMTGTAISALSERKILGGNQHALPVDLFSSRLAYVALGHLHKAQQVGDWEHVRYSGSPIPLSMTEAPYEHQVLRVDLDGEQLVSVESLRVPRLIDLLRVPDEGSAPRAQVLEALAELEPADPGRPTHTLPYLHVHVRVEGYDPTLRRAIEQAVADRAVRLVQITLDRPDSPAGLADTDPNTVLRDLEPTEVFTRLWQSAVGDEAVPADVLAAFHELRDRAHQEADQ